METTPDTPTTPSQVPVPTPAKSDPIKKESPREILNRRFHEAIKAAQQSASFPSQSQIQNGVPVSVAHTRDSISPSSRICQARSRIASHLKGLVKPIPMPEKLRQERIKAGISVPDPKIQYVIVSGEKPANPDTQEW